MTTFVRSVGTVVGAALFAGLLGACSSTSGPAEAAGNQPAAGGAQPSTSSHAVGTGTAGVTGSGSKTGATTTGSATPASTATSSASANPTTDQTPTPMATAATAPNDPVESVTAADQTLCVGKQTTIRVTVAKQSPVETVVLNYGYRTLDGMDYFSAPQMTYTVRPDTPSFFETVIGPFALPGRVAYGVKAFDPSGHAIPAPQHEYRIGIIDC